MFWHFLLFLPSFFSFLPHFLVFVLSIKIYFYIYELLEGSNRPKNPHTKGERKMTEEATTVLTPAEEPKKSKILAAVRKYWKKGAIAVAILAAAAGAAAYLMQNEGSEGDSGNGDTV
jgi:hypothetical protein